MLDIQTGKWEGLDQLGEDAFQALLKPAELAVDRAGMLFANELRKTLSGGRTGRLYKVSKKGPLHQASAPGEPPAVLFGKLKQGIFNARPKWEGWQVSVEIGVGGAARKYARRLEWGGVDSRGVRILPRPYIEPTVLRTEAEIDALLQSSVKGGPSSTGGEA